MRFGLGSERLKENTTSRRKHNFSIGKLLIPFCLVHLFAYAFIHLVMRNLILCNAKKYMNLKKYLFIYLFIIKIGSTSFQLGAQAALELDGPSSGGSSVT